MADDYDIHVSVETHYLDHRSSPNEDRFVFAYTITITNYGKVGAQLLRRHWIVKDSDERVQEVRGDGVVGEQPHLMPGESYQYTSGTVLETPVGTMEGSYQMIADDGAQFDATNPLFVLAAKQTLHKVREPEYRSSIYR
ncbi:MAG: Co2+/Mg2+ efflux protein ApaG [Gammaproteobacteria bacterium]|nr:Co2+/Mg2+ efflux protein ApaG [Gammaproteobacteria bacterium]